MIPNTTATKFKTGDKVAVSNSFLQGTITQLVQPFGTAGEWNYHIEFTNGTDGSGWRDYDLSKLP